MNIFERKKISLLHEKIELQKANAHSNGRFSLFDAKFANDIFSKAADYKTVKYYYDLISEKDDDCNLSYAEGISLDKLAQDNTVMVHRTRAGLDTGSEGLTYNEDLYNIMNDGLKNYGHLNAMGGGAMSKEPPQLTLTMTPLRGLAGYINLLSSWKGNDAVVIAAFPKDIVNSDGDVLDNSKYKNIYDLTEYPPKIKQEYMVGAILKKSNGLDEFYTRDEIISSKDNVISGNRSK